MLTEGKGIPLAVIVTGANVHDIHGLEALLELKLIEKAQSVCRQSHLCLDAGYISPDTEQIVRTQEMIPHIRPRQEEKKEKQQGKQPRRWVVERTHSWMNRYRRLLVRWEKKESNYLGFIQLACAITVLSKLFPG